MKEGRSNAERPCVRDMEADEALQASGWGCRQTTTTAGLSWRALAVTDLGQAGEQREQRHGGRRHGLYVRSCVQEQKDASQICKASLCPRNPEVMLD